MSDTHSVPDGPSSTNVPCAATSAASQNDGWALVLQGTDMVAELMVCQVLLGAPLAAGRLLRGPAPGGSTAAAGNQGQAATQPEVRARAPHERPTNVAAHIGGLSHRDGRLYEVFSLSQPAQVLAFVRGSSPQGDADLLPGMVAFTEAWLARVSRKHHHRELHWGGCSAVHCLPNHFADPMRYLASVLPTSRSPSRRSGTLTAAALAHPTAAWWHSSKMREVRSCWLGMVVHPFVLALTALAERNAPHLDWTWRPAPFFLYLRTICIPIRHAAVTSWLAVHGEESESPLAAAAAVGRGLQSRLASLVPHSQACTST